MIDICVGVISDFKIDLFDTGTLLSEIYVVNDLFDTGAFSLDIHCVVNDVAIVLDIVDVGKVIIPLWVRSRAMRCSPRSICTYVYHFALV